MITSVEGVRVGHWTDTDAATGCTVVLLPPGTTASCFLAGSAPATRETDVLAPANLVAEVQAFVLAGRSTFGLAAADGVIAWLEERRIGFRFADVVVPLVPAAALFDLGVGDARVRPGPAQGRAAAEAASSHVEEGSVGAGTGATVGKWAGAEHAMKGGIGTASVRAGDVVVGALVANNAVGDVLDERGGVLAGSRAGREAAWALRPSPSTVLCVVATNARLDKAGCAHVARTAATGIARTVRPAHTLFDGDIVFACATGGVDAELAVLGGLAAGAVEDGVRRSVRLAGGLAGVPGLAG